MATVYLVRHAISQANVDGVLAGRTPGVGLAEGAAVQLDELRNKFADKHIDAVVCSPLLRAQLTAEAISMDITTDFDLNECDYGTWSNKLLSELTKDSLWESIQHRPSEVQFPGGEHMANMQQRAVNAVERWRNAADSVALVSHGDVIKSVIAYYSKISLDSFQGIRVPPASVVRMEFLPSQVRILNILYSSHGSEIGGGRRG